MKKMNNYFKKESLKDFRMPSLIDSFNNTSDGYYLVEYDGWEFEAKSVKAVINKVLKYIFDGGEE
jgi:phage pi2 protein 07